MVTPTSSQDIPAPEPTSGSEGTSSEDVEQIREAIEMLAEEEGIELAEGALDQTTFVQAPGTRGVWQPKGWIPTQGVLLHRDGTSSFRFGTIPLEEVEAATLQYLTGATPSGEVQREDFGELEAGGLLWRLSSVTIGDSFQAFAVAGLNEHLAMRGWVRGLAEDGDALVTHVLIPVLELFGTE